MAIAEPAHRFPDWAALIGALRRALGETEEVFGRRWGQTHGSVWQWEHHRSLPRPELHAPILLLAGGTFGVPIVALLPPIDDPGAGIDWGLRVPAILAKHRLKQRELAAMVGVQVKQVSLWIRGDHVPRPNVQRQLLAIEAAAMPPPVVRAILASPRFQMRTLGLGTSGALRLFSLQDDEKTRQAQGIEWTTGAVAVHWEARTPPETELFPSLAAFCAAWGRPGWALIVREP